MPPSGDAGERPHEALLCFIHVRAQKEQPGQNAEDDETDTCSSLNADLTFNVTFSIIHFFLQLDFNHTVQEETTLLPKQQQKTKTKKKTLNMQRSPGCSSGLINYCEMFSEQTLYVTVHGSCLPCK